MGTSFKCALVFGDNMVLQRGKPVPIFGFGQDGSKVVVEFQNQQQSTIVENGLWSVTLSPLTTTENETMKVLCDGTQLVFSGVAVGEVWLAGGQSNMEFFFRYDADHDQVVPLCENSRIRFFDYPEVSHEGALESHDYSRFGFWRLANPDNIDYFSAVGYYYAVELQKKLNCPVGIIGCNWGGTTASSWMDPKYLENNDGKIWLQDYENATKNLDLEKHYEDFKRNPLHYNVDPFASELIDQLMRGMTKFQSLIFFMKVGKMIKQGKITLEPSIGPWYENRPGGLYEVMLKKIAPYAIKGVLWYQGESDDKHPGIYDTVFSSLIKCWRELWKEELPFLFVQLAPYGKWMGTSGEKFPIIREKQEWVSNNIPNTWMASIMDAGNKTDIHPKKKKPVGTRLALLAIGKVYGYDILCEAPCCDHISVLDKKLVLDFQNAGSRLILEGHRINGLEIICDDRKLNSSRFSVNNSSITIVNDMIEVGSKVEVRFAYSGFCEVNLFNSSGLPAKPFHIV